MVAIKVKRKPVKISGNMTPMQIRRKRVTIVDKLHVLQLQLHTLQELCQHPNADKKHLGNTGNYDPSADVSWIDWRCPDCAKQWETEQ